MVTQFSNGTLTVEYPWYIGTGMFVVAVLIGAGGIQWFRSLRRDGGGTAKKIRAVVTAMIGGVLIVASVFLFSYKLVIGPEGAATHVFGHANAMKWADVRAVSYYHHESRSLKGRKSDKERIRLASSTGRMVNIDMGLLSDDLALQIGKMVAENVPSGALPVDRAEWDRLMTERPQTEP